MRVVPKAEPILFGLALLLLVRYLPSGIAGILTKPTSVRPLPSAPIRPSDEKVRPESPFENGAAYQCSKYVTWKNDLVA